MLRGAASSQDGKFPQTRWSLVLNAQEDDPAALAQLCRAYWFPLYCYARRMGQGAENAKDLTQGFFEMLLTRQGLKLARSDRGKLRVFLLTALGHFAYEQHRKSTAQKRGGGAAMIEIDALEAEQRYALEPRDELSPEREFDRAWARQLLASVLAQLGEAYRAAGKGGVFAALQDHLTGGSREDYAAAAQALGLSPAAVRYASFKLRERYRGLLREAIQQTVTTEEEVTEELAQLRGLFAA
jgi:DNA-directed RNA polymerase specialized sigma24 family protein